MTALRKVRAEAARAAAGLCLSAAACLAAASLGACAGPPRPYAQPEAVPTRAPLHPPRTYEAPYTARPVVIDGTGDEAAWGSVPWTAPFVDIEGSDRPAPALETRAKMCWDGTHLYVLAHMEEPDIWATYATRDMIVFHENDIEIFIDPDGDSREYYEIEVNALGTVFDLQLRLPYRAGGPAMHQWDTPGLKVAVHLDGTLNDPRDRDRAWTCEMAIPWTALRPLPDTGGFGPAQRAAMPPRPGDTWRINFSRVQWDLERVEDGYRKVEGRPEWNWVWSPQWIIDMHVPWHWGRVTFVKGGAGGSEA